LVGPTFKGSVVQRGRQAGGSDEGKRCEMAKKRIILKREERGGAS